LRVVESSGSATVCDVDLMEKDGVVVVRLVHLVCHSVFEGGVGEEKVDGDLEGCMYEAEWIRVSAHIMDGVSSIQRCLVVGGGWLRAGLVGVFGEGCVCVGIHDTLSKESVAVALSGDFDAVVHVGALEEGVSGVDVVDSVLHLCREMVRKMDVSSGGGGPLLCVVTRGTQAASGDGAVVSAEHAGVWGCARAVRAECRDVRLLCVDIDGGVVANDGVYTDMARRVLNEVVRVVSLSSLASEDVEVVLGEGEGDRFVYRLGRSSLLPEFPSTFSSPTPPSKTE